MVNGHPESPLFGAIKFDTPGPGVLEMVLDALSHHCECHTAQAVRSNMGGLLDVLEKNTPGAGRLCTYRAQT